MMSEQLRTLAMFMNKFPQSINRYMENNFVLLGYFRAHTVILTVSDDKIEACQLCGSRHTLISTPSHSQCFLFSILISTIIITIEIMSTVSQTTHLNQHPVPLTVFPIVSDSVSSTCSRNGDEKMKI